MNTRHDLTLSIDFRKELRECFDAIDANQCGEIDIRDTAIAMRAMGHDTKKDEVRRIAEAILREGQTSGKMFTGRVDFDLFARMVHHKLNEAANDDVFKHHFANIKDDSGMISLSSLKKAARDCGLSFTDDELSLMINEADIDKDGYVNDTEFKQILFS